MSAPTKMLPAGSRLAWSIDIRNNPRLGLGLQLLATLAIFPFWGLFVGLAVVLKPELNATQLVLDSAMWVIVTLVPVILLHELVHGLFFWWFSRDRPRFGLGWGYAYAAAPDWFFEKRQYLVIGLAPLAGISLLGGLLIGLTPVSWSAAWVSAMLLNAAGAMGDAYICWKIGREPADVWIRDTGDGFEIYRREAG